MKKKVEDILSEDKISCSDKQTNGLNDQEKLALAFNETFATIKQDRLTVQDRDSLWKGIYNQTLSAGQDIHRIRRKPFHRLAIALIFILGSTFAIFYFRETPDTIKTVAMHNKKYFSGNTEVALLKADKRSVTLHSGTLIRYERLQTQTKASQTPQTPLYSSIGVPYGKRSELLLEDGTKIWLNAGSILTFPEHFDAGKREVYLEGEGYFDVAPDMHRPFTVKSAHMDVHVLGTRFNISTYADDAFASTVLLSGKVEVASNGTLAFDKQLLTPGMEARINKEQQTLQVAKAPEGSISWTKRRLLLHKMSIMEIAKKLERFYNTPIVDQSGFTADDTFSGSLDLSQDLQEVLQNIYDKQLYTTKLIERRMYIQKK